MKNIHNRRKETTKIVCEKYVIRNNKLNWRNHQNELQEVLFGREDIDSILDIFHDYKGPLGVENHTMPFPKLLLLERNAQLYKGVY